MRKLLLLALAGFLALAGPAQAQKTKAAITTEINTFFADNTTGQITPAKLRTVTTDIVNSYVDWLTCAGTGGIVYWSGGVPTCLAAGVSGQLLQTNGGSLAPSWITPSSLPLVVGTTPVTSGSSGFVLYNNAGVLGNLDTTGSGLVVLQTSPSLVTPVIGVATGTSLALGGCTIGANVYCANGNTALNGLLSVTSNSSTALTVGPNGTTNPVLNVDASTASQATGIKVRGAATGSGAFLSVVSSGANDPLSIDAKGSGTVVIAGNSTGAIGLQRQTAVSSSSANAFAAGANGSTNPALNVDASTASSATGLNVKSAAAAGGLAVSVLSSGTNENLTLNAKGSGTISIGNVSTGAVALGGGGGAVTANGNTVTVTIASGTSALGTSAIASGACATVVTTSATNTATTDVVDFGFNGDPTATTGYIAPNMLAIIAYPSANNVNFKVCNNTAGSITPGAITLNWKVRR